MKDNNKKIYYEWNDILFLIGYITLTFLVCAICPLTICRNEFTIETRRIIYTFSLFFLPVYIILVFIIIRNCKYTIETKQIEIDTLNGIYYEAEDGEIRFYKKDSKGGLNKITFEKYENINIVKDKYVKAPYCKYTCKQTVSKKKTMEYDYKIFTVFLPTEV